MNIFETNRKGGPYESLRERIILIENYKLRGQNWFNEIKRKIDNIINFPS